KKLPIVTEVVMNIHCRAFASTGQGIFSIPILSKQNPLWAERVAARIYLFFWLCTLRKVLSLFRL
ncbi:MAG: hypothetical protein UV42_C0024G0001, partial [Candidatus Magasanikbacteria bacterium GW2011_GWE2_42_7]